MRIIYTLVAIFCFAFTSYGQCYDQINVLSDSPDIDCSDGMVILNIDIRAGSTGAGNSCVTVIYTSTNPGASNPISLNVESLQGPRQIILNEIDCDAGIQFVSRTNPTCGGKICADVTYPDVEIFITENTILPISLHSFSVEATKDQNALLKWATSSEVDNDFFLIERSANGKAWETIGRIAGNGNSSSMIEYEFLDRSTLTGKSYYRLIDVDNAGNETASHVVSFDSRGLDIGFTAFPNPVKNELSLDKLELNDEVSIFSQDGKLVLSQEVNESNIYNFKVDLSTYSNGVFMIRLIRGQEVYTDRIVKN